MAVFLMKIGEQGYFTFPIHCVQCDRYLIVSDYLEHCVKVFTMMETFSTSLESKVEGTGS